MANTVNDFSFVGGYNANLSYQKHDVVYGVTATDYNFYYLTQDYSPAGGGTLGSPWARLSYPVTAWERTDDLATVYFAKTGSQADFTAGSTFSITGSVQTSLNFTGMCIDGGSNFVKFINPGWNQVYTALTTSAVFTTLNPAFSTGFFWVPSNTTSVDFTTKRDFAQFGDGYTQQGRLGINSIGSVINMTFENRSYREAKAILNYVQVAGGTRPVTINLPVNVLFNNPSTKYLLTDPRVALQSYNLNNITVIATRVYTPSTNSLLD